MVKPYEMHASMSTSPFVDKFASLLKVEGEEHLAKYHVNLDILVSACAEMLNGYVIIVYSVAQVHKNSATTKGKNLLAVCKVA